MFSTEKASLTDFSFAVNSGVPQFSTDGGTTWNNMGGSQIDEFSYTYNAITIASHNSIAFTPTNSLPSGANPLAFVGISWEGYGVDSFQLTNYDLSTGSIVVYNPNAASYSVKPTLTLTTY